jgi:hypothetical protein
MNLARCLCVVSLALGAFAPFGTVQAQDALVGSWVLDPASSKGPPNVAPTGGTLEITDAGGGKFMSVSEATVGGVTGRSETTYSIDGKDYAVTATPSQPGVAITQSIERASANVFNSSIKLNGQLIATAVTELSNDGKTLTQTTTGVGQFATLSSSMVFQRK